MSDSISQKIKSPAELQSRYKAYRLKLRKLGEEKNEIDTYTRFLREEEGWTNMRIGELLGISRQRVGQWMGGKS